MASVFLDANKVFDSLARRSEYMADLLEGHTVYTTPLNIHIFCYVFDRKMPSPELRKTIREDFHLVPVTEKITYASLQGPTKYYEDNIQLHTAASVDCDYFMTTDKQLLKTGYFGKVRIVDHLGSFS